MTECQLGLHQPVIASRDGLNIVVCSTCGKTINYLYFTTKGDAP